MSLIVQGNTIIQGRTMVNGLLLNQFSGSQGAYSVRKLSTTYTGSALRVRRSIDNTEQDIGFDAYGNLDETSLTTFVGTGSQNLYTYSEQFNNAIWTNFSTTITPNDIIAPDGTLTADKFVCTATNAPHSITQSYSASLGVRYTVSIYAKAGTQSVLQYVVSSQASDYANFDLVNGTVSVLSGTGTYAIIEPSSNGFYRCTFSYLPNAPANNSYYVIQNSTSAARYASWSATTSDYIYIWGAQLTTEAVVPKKYVATTSSTVTTNNMGYVVRIYDQSTNSNHATQSTTAYQPIIVNGGSVITRNNKPSVLYNENSYLELTNKSFTNGLSYLSAFAVSQSLSSTISMNLFAAQRTISGTRFSLNFSTATANKFTTYARRDDSQPSASALTSTSNFSTTSIQLYSSVVQYADAKGYQYINNTLDGQSNSYTTAGVTSNTDLDGVNIGSYNTTSGKLTGYISELVLFTTNITSNVPIINSNINSYYNIY